MHRSIPISWSPVYCKILCSSINKRELFCGIYDPSLTISKFRLCICPNLFLELTCMWLYFRFCQLFRKIHCRPAMFQKLWLFLIFFTLQQCLGVLGEIPTFWLNGLYSPQNLGWEPWWVVLVCRRGRYDNHFRLDIWKYSQDICY